MRIVIRTDSSRDIGTGHLMRCLTLAEKLRRAGTECLFVCRDLEGNLNHLVERSGFALVRLRYDDSMREYIYSSDYARWLVVTQEQDVAETATPVRVRWGRADWLVVDHYGIDHKWQSSLRSCADRILVIDDLANRRHDCDLLLDQNLQTHARGRYEALVHSGCELLLGPPYALLRDEFVAERTSARPRSGDVRRLLIFFGGVDPTDETRKVLRALESVATFSGEVDVVVGAANPRKDELRDLCRSLRRVHFRTEVDNMAELMSQADLALAAGGTNTWERCCMGLASVVVAVAENQVPIGSALSRFGIARFLGRSSEVTVNLLTEEMKRLLVRPDLVRHMSKASMALVDGRGTSRVVHRMLAHVAKEKTA